MLALKLRILFTPHTGSISAKTIEERKRRLTVVIENMDWRAFYAQEGLDPVDNLLSQFSTGIRDPNWPNPKVDPETMAFLKGGDDETPGGEEGV
jgi:hypothetical protein